MCAASYGHLLVFQYLVEQGAALDMADNVRAGKDICYAILVMMMYVLYRVDTLPS